MASPYYTTQPVFLEDPSKRYRNILSNKFVDSEDAGLYAEGETRGRRLIGPTRLNFPFTPTISVIQSTNYNQYDITHSNFQQRAFDSHTNMELNITAPMIVRSEEEALYVYNAATWIRSVMKMTWLRDDEPGLPPPILRFTSHGIYENVPCMVRDFTWNLDSDIDYVEIEDPTNKKKIMRIPVTNMFVLSLSTTYSPKSVRKNFSVKDYLGGKLKGHGYV